MSRLFVVDTENTNDYSFINNYSIGSQDEIVLFISDKMKAVKADGCIELLTSSGKIQIEKIENGEKNALDFQLVVYITERALCGNYDEIYIVSKDHGYRPVIGYIKKKFDKQINIISSGREMLSRREAPSKTIESDKNSKGETKEKLINEDLSQDEKIKEVILKVVPKASQNQINKILNLNDNNAPLVDIHSNLLKMFKDDGKSVYKNIKPFIERKK